MEGMTVVPIQIDEAAGQRENQDGAEPESQPTDSGLHIRGGARGSGHAFGDSVPTVERSRTLVIALFPIALYTYPGFDSRRKTPLFA
jgi:hypothetical protein